MSHTNLSYFNNPFTILSFTILLQALLTINLAINTFFKQVCYVSTESDEKEAGTHQLPAIARTGGSYADGGRVSPFH